MGPFVCVGSSGLVGSVGHIEPCDCVSTVAPSGHVGLSVRVAPCGAVWPCGVDRPCGV